MIIPRRPTVYWIRLIAVGYDDRVLLVREERPGAAPVWSLPGLRRDPKDTAERAADTLRARLALPTAEPQRLRERTVTAIVAGEVPTRPRLICPAAPCGS